MFSYFQKTAETQRHRHKTVILAQSQSFEFHPYTEATNTNVKQYLPKTLDHAPYEPLSVPSPACGSREFFCTSCASRGKYQHEKSWLGEVSPWQHIRPACASHVTNLFAPTTTHTHTHSPSKHPHSTCASCSQIARDLVAAVTVPVLVHVVPSSWTLLR